MQPVEARRGCWVLGWELETTELPCRTWVCWKISQFLTAEPSLQSLFRDFVRVAGHLWRRMTSSFPPQEPTSGLGIILDSVCGMFPHLLSPLLQLLRALVSGKSTAKKVSALVRSLKRSWRGCLRGPLWLKGALYIGVHCQEKRGLKLNERCQFMVSLQLRVYIKIFSLSPIESAMRISVQLPDTCSGEDSRIRKWVINVRKCFVLSASPSSVSPEFDSQHWSGW